MATLISTPEAEVKSMGQVTITFEVANNDDVQRTRERGAGGTRVRQVTLADALMDTGASHLCLPAEVIEQLGLPLDREVPVETPTGLATLRVFQSARIAYADRTAEVEAIELARGSRPLFGALAMEALGVEPDTRLPTVRVLPFGEAGRSFIRA